MKLVVKQIHKETENVLSIMFEKPKGFEFYPAQFVDIIFPDIKVDNSRIYSLSSSPTENYLMITFKKGISDHKKKLMNLKPKDIVEITHPNGTYTLDELTPAVMLAGGVGIAPHRSMIKYAMDKKINLPLILIFSNSTKNFPFKKELDSLSEKQANLDIHYVVTGKNGRLTKPKLNSILKNYFLKAEPIYYLAGPPSFVYDFNQILQTMDIDSVNIRLDSFDGY